MSKNTSGSARTFYVADKPYWPNGKICQVLTGIVVGWKWHSCLGRHATLKMLHCKSKMQFVKKERNTPNAIALLNYLKCIVLQQLILRAQVFTKKCLSATFKNNKVTSHIQF